ncbi:DUF3696 domain-containing protein [Streptosporangium sp. NPDC023825]|uniref:AAA family ATPase n=1 Tax=Streptosporangium sp. NPDC023825 TaxID=3154909 RepID=UPI003428DFFC
MDLVYGNNVHRPLGLGFSVDLQGKTYNIKTTIQNIAELHVQVVRYFEMTSERNRVVLEWQQDSAEMSYRIIFDEGEEGLVSNPFVGLIPDSGFFSSDRFGFHDPAVFESLRRGFGQISYLGPYRQRPSRLVRLPARSPRDVGSAGEHAVGMLISDQVRNNRRLLDEVNALLGDSLAGWQLDVETQGPLYSVILRSTTDPSLRVNLLDSGTGVAQVLPLLVQLARSPGDLQVVEEPELHLHPAFHALLADLFITETERGSSRFLIETHSETMLLRLRRRIAEGRISSDAVAVHFVDHENGSSRVRRINIDDFGNLDYWPAGVFSEDFEETKKLAEAQFARGRDEG